MAANPGYSVMKTERVKMVIETSKRLAAAIKALSLSAADAAAILQRWNKLSRRTLDIEASHGN